jgi:hypothetical protein
MIKEFLSYAKDHSEDEVRVLVQSLLQDDTFRKKLRRQYVGQVSALLAYAERYAKEEVRMLVQWLLQDDIFRKGLRIKGDSLPVGQFQLPYEDLVYSYDIIAFLAYAETHAKEEVNVFVQRLLQEGIIRKGFRQIPYYGSCIVQYLEYAEKNSPKVAEEFVRWLLRDGIFRETLRRGMAGEFFGFPSGEFLTYAQYIAKDAVFVWLCVNESETYPWYAIFGQGSFWRDLYVLTDFLAYAERHANEEVSVALQCLVRADTFREGLRQAGADQVSAFLAYAERYAKEEVRVSVQWLLQDDIFREGLRRQYVGRVNEFLAYAEGFGNKDEVRVLVEWLLQDDIFVEGLRQPGANAGSVFLIFAMKYVKDELRVLASALLDQNIDSRR